MYSLIVTMLHDFLCNLLINFPPYNAIISHSSLIPWRALQGWWYIEWTEKGVNMETIDYIIFFKGLKNIEIDIGFNDVEDFIHFQAQLSDTGLNIMLVHTFATNVTSNRHRYLLLTSQASSCLRNDVKNRGGAAKWGNFFFQKPYKLC